jgi:hypothetical protein
MHQSGGFHVFVAWNCLKNERQSVGSKAETPQQDIS